MALDESGDADAWAPKAEALRLPSALTRVGRAAGLEINDPYADEDLPYLEDDYDNEAMLDALSARDVPVFQCGNPSGMGSSSE